MNALPVQILSVQNESSVVDSKLFFNSVWGAAYQLKYHFGRSRWITQRLAPPAKVVMLGKGEKPPPGAWNIVLMDRSEEQGTLGFHSDAEGTKIPFSDVFCIDAQEGGASVASVLSHEAIEMLVDPHVATPYIVRRGNELYIVEVCDPCQGNDYDVGEPENRKVGITVADFCEPAWWQILGSAGPLTFRRSITEPFKLADEGYISVAPANDPSKFQPVFGSKITELPKWASRLPRIHAAAATPPGPPAPPRSDRHRPVG